MKTLSLMALLALLVGMRPVAEPARSDVSAISCKMLNGKDRPFPCEFEIVTLWFMGKNNEVLGKSTANGQAVVLPKSKAVSSTPVGSGGSLFYHVSVDFRRINSPSFSTSAYRLTKASITDPISPGETSVVNDAVRAGSNLTPPHVRPNRLMFKMQLNYADGGGSLTLIAPPQLLMLENPVTYAKLTKPPYQHDRDRAEAWRTMTIWVDFKK